MSTPLVDELFGYNYRPDPRVNKYFHSMTYVRMGSLKNYQGALLIKWFDGEYTSDDLLNTAVITEEHLHKALMDILSTKFCCDMEIAKHGLRYGCLNAINILLQQALFGEQLYA